MASVITELDQFDASITVPDDGDTSGAASVTSAGVGFQPLANRTTFLKNRSAAASGGNLAVALDASINTNARFTFAFGLAAPDYTQFQTDVTDAGGIQFHIPPIFGVQITNVIARVHGDAGGVGTHAGLPGTLPIIELLSLDSTSGTGTVTSIATQVDTSASVGAYETMHNIDLGSLTEVAGDNLTYIVRFTGETGANALVNRLALYQILLTLNPV